MMNYIYSVIKRGNFDSKGNFSWRWFLKQFFVTIMSFLLFIFLCLFLVKRVFFEDENSTIDIIILICCWLVIVYPIFYALYPGYKYLESVQKYTQLKATFISILIVFLPNVLLFYLISLVAKNGF